ncbi:MAG: sel1 repeat family protein, partial [Nitratireductor sp.]|nr:sel1 repeat family protein [Nitratireductor sp.]
YGEGLGVEKDDAVAFQWMEKAARAGIDTAQVELGIWLANGRGTTKDEKAALGWMQRAARSGNAIAQNRLAKMYALGIGTQKNAAEAGKWHIIAQRAGLDDPWLSEFIARLDPVERNKALADANRWPGG